MDIRPIFSSLRRHKIPVLLIIIEIGLTCFIGMTAVFGISQLAERMRLSSGLAEQQLVLLQTTGGAAQLDDGHARLQEDLTVLRQVPGVKSVSAVNGIPFGGSRSLVGVRLSSDQPQATVVAATYFGEDLVNTFGLHLLAGRSFEPGEYIDSSDVASGKQQASIALVTRALATRLWPDQSALGKTLYAGSGQAVRVVGIIASLIQPGNLGGQDAQWSMVMPVRMSTSGAFYVLRTAPDQRQTVIKAAVAKLKSANPRRIFLQKRTLDAARADAFRTVRSMVNVMAGVIIALLLVTALGIVGLASFWVAKRRHTIGVRRALGATRADILRYFQVENFLIVSIGIVLGMLLAYGLNLVLMQHLAMPRLPYLYLPVGAVALWLLGQLAVLLPAIRASRVPPAVATRSV